MACCAGQAGPSSGVVSGSAPPGSAPPKLALPGNALPGAAPQGAHPSNPLPGSISARLATLERDVSSANRQELTQCTTGYA